jgi:hypothetical protein
MKSPKKSRPFCSGIYLSHEENHVYNSKEKQRSKTFKGAKWLSLGWGVAQLRCGVAQLGCGVAQLGCCVAQSGCGVKILC